MGSLLVQRVNLYQMIGIKQKNDKFVFGGQGPQPMRFGSLGNSVSTGAARNGAEQVSVL